MTDETTQTSQDPPFTLETIHTGGAAEPTPETPEASGDTETTLEALLNTMLFEGYALFPYTPGATKNRTPTPFGIVYPPVYAAGSPHTFDQSRMQVVLRPGAEAAVSATVAFLEPAGERQHEGIERRIEIAATNIDALLAAPVAQDFKFDAVLGTVELSAEPLPAGGLIRVTLTAENKTVVEEGLDRPNALRASLLSTHLILQTQDGKFVSPIAPESDAQMAVTSCKSVNIFPVLATDEDDAVLGACIMLPDHPQLAPESKYNMFDSTEIEEALLIHVLALSDGERELIAENDPKVRAMIERATNATPEEMARVRGRVTITRPEDSKEPLSPVGGPIEEFADIMVDATGPPLLDDEEAIPGLGGPMFRPAPEGTTIELPSIYEAGGEEEVTYEGVTYKRGDKVRLRPAFGRSNQDMVWDGAVATIERLMLDVDDEIHVCVTLDNDPGRELMRDMGRYLYFSANEVEAIS